MPETYQTLDASLFDNREFVHGTETMPETEGSIWGAAFRQENDMLNLWSMVTKPTQRFDAEFDLGEALKRSEIGSAFPEPFYGALSQEDFDAIESRLLQEQADRQRLLAGGWGGLGASMAAGLLSPTILLPSGAGVRAGSFVAGARSSATWALLGSTAQEAILQGNQELRTTGESALSVGTNVVLAGLLGGALGYLGRDKEAKLQDPTTWGTEVNTQEYNVTRGVGADVVDFRGADAGRLEGGAVVGKVGGVISPVADVINNRHSRTASWMMGQLDNAGLKFEKNVEGISAAPGGDIASRSKAYMGMYYKAQKESLQYYKAYMQSQGKGAIKQINPMESKRWNLAVGDALFTPSGVPEIDAAAKSFKDFYNAVLEEAKAAGIPGLKDIKDSEGYVTHVIKKGMVANNLEDFTQIIKENATRVFREEYDAIRQRAARRIQARKQTQEDLALDEAGMEDLRKQLEAEIASLPETFGGDIEDITTDIRALRAEARNSKTLSKEERKNLRDQAAKLEEDNKDLLQPFRAKENTLKYRFRNLNASAGGLAKQKRALLARIEGLEDDQVATMNRAIKSGQRFLNKLGKLTDDQLDEELEKLNDQFERAFGVFERGEERLAKMPSLQEVTLEASDETPTDKLSKAQALQADREARATALLDKLEAAKNLDRDAARQAVQDAMDEFAQRQVKTISRRAERINKLKATAAQTDPKYAHAEVSRLQSEIDNIIRQTDNRIEYDMKTVSTGADEFGLPIPDIDKAAQKVAEDIANSHLTEATGLPNINLIMERGPLIRRTLDIDPNVTWSNGRAYKEFLERDIEILGRRYTRSMAGDIELYRVFGTVNPLTGDNKAMTAIREEFAAAKREAAAKGEDVSAIVREEAEVKRNLEAVVGRIRHTWGIPENPNGLAHRFGRVALNLNTLRYMGGVTISSIPDLAQPMIKYGVLKTFKTGFLPLVTDLKGFQMIAEEIRLAGVALDVFAHSRSAGMFDLFDEMENGTRAERALQQMTNNMGRIALFDYWTSGVKQFAGIVGVTELSQQMGVMLAENSSQKALKRANRFLTQVGIDHKTARMIAREMEKPGATTMVNGIPLPNTQAWTNMEAVRAYRAAIARLVDDTIITPGVERPRWVDETMTGRLVGQFRSFTFSTTTKTILNAYQNVHYGVKHRDLQVAAMPILGSMFSLGAGAMSYWAWAHTRGGSTLEEMRNAGMDKWADEAILRSGLLGVLGEVQKIAERIPATSPYATISGRPTERSPFVSPLEDAMGPTFGALFSDADKVLVAAGGDTENTVQAGRKLLPYQNLFWLKMLERFADDS